MKEFIPYSTDLISRMYNEEKIKHFLQVKQLFEISWIPLEILQNTYQSLSNSGTIQKIEDLEEVDKKRLWRIISGWVQGEKEHKVNCVKVLHLIEVLQDKKIEA